MKLPIISKRPQAVKAGSAFPQRLRVAHEGRISLSPWAIYKGAQTHIAVECNGCGHEWSARPTDLINSKSGCPKCCYNRNVGQVKSAHPLYKTYLGMIYRCNSPESPSFHHYGGRGIKVCPEWQEDFWTFVADVGEKPTPKHTLDRIDNDKGYSKDNCRWATPSQQHANRRPVLNAKGVRQRPSGKFEAAITIDGEWFYLGLFDCPLMARLAFEEARNKKLAGEPVK